MSCSGDDDISWLEKLMAKAPAAQTDWTKNEYEITRVEHL